jgi:hypothetical protein
MSIWNYPDSTPAPHAFAGLAECPFCTIYTDLLFPAKKAGWKQVEAYLRSEGYL